MGANPYVTVPAGTASQQALYVQALYRNAALQAQQPDWGDVFGAGLGGGINAGLGQYFGQLDRQQQYQQQWDLELAREQARADAQMRAFEQQNALLAERERAAADAANRKALLDEYLAAQKQRTIGRSLGTLAGIRGTALPGTGLPEDLGAFGETPPTPATPPQYPDYSQALAQMQGMPGGDAMIGALAGQNELVKPIFEATPGGWDANTRGLLEQAYKMAGSNADVVPDLLAKTPLGRRGLQPELPKPEKPPAPNYTEGFNTFLGSRGQTPESYQLLPPLDQKSLYDEWRKADEEQRTRIQLAESTITDQRMRAQKADEGKSQLGIIHQALDVIEPLVPQVLAPGVTGRIQGGIKAKLNEWLQLYPELKQLKTFSAATVGPVVRQISRDTGAMSVSDIDRAMDAFVVQESDSLETALIKARALRAFATAADQAWDVYRSTTFQTPLEEINRRIAASRRAMLDAVTIARNATPPTLPEPPPGSRRVR